MGTPPPNPLPIRRPVRFWSMLMASLILIFGFDLNDALVSRPNIGDGLAHAGFFGLVLFIPMIGGCIAVNAVIAMLADIRRGGRSGWWLILPAGLISLGFITDGVYQHLPSTRFRKFVADPMPESVRNIRMSKADSFGDGYAWMLAFDIDPADFESLRQSMNLHEVAINRTAREKEIAAQLADLQPNSTRTPEWIKDQAWPEDHLLRRDSRGLYVRPADARFFNGRDRTVVVTDQKNSTVYVYRNNWSDPSEK